MILDQIIETKKEEVAKLKRETSIARLCSAIAERPPCRNFRAAASGRPCAIIAEVKCASPSRGRLVEHFDPLSIAGIYEQSGAAAISVLTDEQYFCGHKTYLTEIKNKVRIPILRKDFIIDPLQLYETRAIGADAVLLIVRVLGQTLSEYIGLAKELGLSPLTEVHSSDELDMALAAGAEVDFVLDLDPGLPALETGRDRLEQVLTNLLDNAFKFTDSGGRVTLAASVSEGGKVALSVADNGVGIAEEDLPFVFDRFFRVEKSRAQRFGGSGLGLAISREVAEALGGVLSVASRPGEGTVFTLLMGTSGQERGGLVYAP